MLIDAAIFAAGLFVWTFLEYLIHGLLGHVWRTPVGLVHDVHHRDPRAVFTIGAWIPVAMVWLGGVAWFGMNGAMIFLTGIVTGFAAYEGIHYRLHFARPATTIEARLRSRHLAHHHCAPDACFGVTSALWDRALGSEPTPPRMRELSASVAGVAPLTGPSNARLLLHPWFFLTR